MLGLLMSLINQQTLVAQNKYRQGYSATNSIMAVPNTIIATTNFV